MKAIYCAGCSTLVAKIEAGSKIMTGATMLCPSCEHARQAAELAMKTRPSKGPSKGYSDFMDDLLRRYFK